MTTQQVLKEKAQTSYPSSSTRRFNLLEQTFIILLPVAVLPVIATMWMSSLEINCSPVFPSPCTTCKTPSGRHDANALQNSAPESGVTSEGLTMTVFPATRAGMARNGISPAGTVCWVSS